MDFQNFIKIKHFWRQIFKTLSIQKTPREHVKSHKKIGPVRFSRIDKQTHKQTPKQTKQSIFIEDELPFVAGHSL